MFADTLFANTFRIVAAASLMVLHLGVATQLDAQVPASDHLTVTQWVQQPTAGEFRARVVVPTDNGGAQLVPAARVILLGSEGRVYRGVTNDEGDVTILGVEPGIYAMTARGRGVFACYAMHVMRPDHPGGELLPTRAEIACAPITYRSYSSTVLPLLANAYDRDELSIEDVRIEQITNHVLGNQRYRVARWDGGIRGYIYEATANGHQNENDDNANRLDPAESQNVFLFRDGLLVGQSMTDDRGQFAVAELPIGIYSLLTVGPDGMGAVGFELIDRADDAEAGADDATIDDAGAGASNTDSARSAKENARYRLVDNGDNGDSEFALQIIPLTEEELELQQEQLPPENIPLPMGDPLVIDGLPIDGVITPMGGPIGPGPGPGGIGGGPGGGGGGFGGGPGGGLGGIATVGGVIAAAAAAGSSGGVSAFSGPITASPDIPSNE